MAKATRTYIGGDSPTDEASRPKHLTKQEFARRLYKKMVAKGWHQSELARQAGVTRDAVSTYVRGVCMPDPINAQKLADALGVPISELLPNQIEMAIDRDPPAIEMKVSASNPGLAWLRINRLVQTSTAMEVVNLLSRDVALEEAKD